MVGEHSPYICKHIMGEAQGASLPHLTELFWEVTKDCAVWRTDPDKELAVLNLAHLLVGKAYCDHCEFAERE